MMIDRSIKSIRTQQKKEKQGFKINNSKIIELCFFVKLHVGSSTLDESTIATQRGIILIA